MSMDSEKPDEKRRIEVELPTPQEVQSLPHNARMAFKARCARRMLPLYEAWEGASPTNVEAVRLAVFFAEQAASGKLLPEPSWDEVLKAVEAVWEWKMSVPDYTLDRSGAADAARTAVITAAAAAAEGIHNVFNAPVWAVDSFVHFYAPVVHVNIKRDFSLLREAASREGWTDDTPVTPEFFGPLWPDEPAPKWLFKGEVKEERLVLRVEVGEFAPENEVVAKLVELCRALSAFHVASGGMGLVVEDWQIFTPAGESAGVR